MQNTKLSDSGERTVFETGAMREITEEKGRCDLVYNRAFGRMTGDNMYDYIELFIRTGDPTILTIMLQEFVHDHYKGCYETAYLELAKHYAEGAKKYNDRNMEKGLPWHSMVDSAMRHYAKFIRGDKDEPHDRAFMWNLITLQYMMDYHPELNDLPCAGKGDIND